MKICKVDGCDNVLSHNNRNGYCKDHTHLNNSDRGKSQYRKVIESEDARKLDMLEGRRKRARQNQYDRVYERKLELYERQPGCYYCCGLAPERFLLIEDIDPAAKRGDHARTSITNQALSCISCNTMKTHAGECVYELLDRLESKGLIPLGKKYRIIETLFYDKIIHTDMPEHWRKYERK